MGVIYKESRSPSKQEKEDLMFKFPNIEFQIDRNEEQGATDDRELRKLRKLFWSKTGKGAGRPRKLKVEGVIEL